MDRWNRVDSRVKYRRYFDIVNLLVSPFLASFSLAHLSLGLKQKLQQHTHFAE